VSEHDPSILDRRRGLYAPERLLMLVDGVFAISMTLLVLDVRVPDDVPKTADAFAGAFGPLLARLGVFVTAFVITSRFWLVNHRQMSVLRVVDYGVAQRTILFLAGITSLPVATGVIFRFGDVPAAVTFAALVLAGTGALSARLWWYLSAPRRHLADVDENTRHETMIRSVLVVGVYLLAVPIAYLLPRDAVGLAPLVWLVLAAVDPAAHRLHRLLRRRRRTVPDSAVQ
jgi:uncharacterized membrane protein